MHARLVVARILAMAILPLGLPLYAQVTTATVYGQVADASGGAIPNAEVLIVNELTGTKMSTQSDGAGSFTFTFLPVGRYAITIRAPGFRETEQTGLQLAAGQTVRLNFRLEVGVVTEKLIVMAETQLINTATAEQDQGFVTRQLLQLPMARRDWTSILQFVGTGVVTEGMATTGVSLNGLASAAMTFTVDGTDASGSSEERSLAMYQGFNYIKGVSLEAIEEVAIAKGIFSAEVAGTLSGGVNIITKSGTNDFHGSLFEYNQTARFQARYQFSASKTPLVFNQFGGSFGGPIKKNKLFFFGVYEGYRRSARNYVSGYVPSLSFRQSAIQAVPAYKQFLDLIPLPTSPGNQGPTAGYYEGTTSTTAHDNHATVRGDYYVNERNRLSGRYTRGRPEYFSPALSTPWGRRWSYAPESGTLNFTHNGTAWVSETRFGYNRISMHRYDTLSALGIMTIPSISNALFGLGGIGSGEDYWNLGSNMSFEEVIAITRGRHSIKFGGLFIRSRNTRSRTELPNMSYASIADFMANVPNSSYFSIGEVPNLMRRYQMGYFIQDNFKVSSHLVVNLGVRYDYVSVPQERDNRFFNRGDPLGLGPFRPPNSIFDADRKDFAPRIGFAWTLDRSSKTVLRGGVGMFYTVPAMFEGPVDIVRTKVDVPQHLTLSRVEALTSGLRYPTTNPEAYAAVGLHVDPLWASQTVISTYNPNAYSIQWSLGVARQLTGTLALETAYVGNHGVHLQFKDQENTVNRQTGIRPFPNLQEFEYDQPADSSHYNSWQTSLRKRFSSGFNANVHYTWASRIAYGNGDLDHIVSSTNSRSLEKGAPPDFIRHLFVSDFLYELPFAKLVANPQRGARLLASGWQFAGILTAETGLPIAGSAAESSPFSASRGDYIGGVPYLPDYRTTLQYLNPNAFAKVPMVVVSGVPARPGNVNRSTLFYPGAWNLDLALSKNLELTERVRFQVRADMFNSLNHTNYSGLSTGVTSATFGKITGTRGARGVQLDARFTF